MGKTVRKKERVGRDSENSSRRVGCIGRHHQGVERRRCVGAVQKDIAKRCKFFAGSGRCSRSACKSIGGTQGVHAATSQQKHTYLAVPHWFQPFHTERVEGEFSLPEETFGHPSQPVEDKCGEERRCLQAGVHQPCRAGLMVFLLLLRGTVAVLLLTASGQWLLQSNVSQTDDLLLTRA